jgi:hypothetical protein
MFGKSLDAGEKRDFMGAVVFYVANLMVLVGVSTVAVHFLGAAGVVDGKAGGFFDGGHVYTLIGSFFVLWLGGAVLHARGKANDILSVVMVLAGTYLAWTTGVMLGLVPVALLTTMNNSK